MYCTKELCSFFCLFVGYGGGSCPLGTIDPCLDPGGITGTNRDGALVLSVFSQLVSLLSISHL